MTIPAQINNVYINALQFYICIHKIIYIKRYINLECSNLGFAQLNSNFSTTKVISLTPNPDWIKSDAGKVICFKIADRYIFQFTEVIFLKDGHVDFADTVLWTLGENTSSGHVFVLRPISDKTDNYFHTVRLYDEE